MSEKLKTKFALSSSDYGLTFICFLREARIAVKNLSRVRFSSTEANKASYNSLNSVRAYASMVNLKKPEQTILNLLKIQAQLKRILDIGVGAGRTTRYFAEMAEEYSGVDYSENMIKHCRETFREYPNVSFAVLDARNLSCYEDGRFDFVLFSSGGLDAVEHKDRIRILNEIKRVTREEGYFWFSTSNLNAMLQFSQVRLSKNPKSLAKELGALMLKRLLNTDMWKHNRGNQISSGHTMFIIGAGNWSL
jgi:ubiquinone/menaquinone biosynthesis C-methylase UbiE